MKFYNYDIKTDRYGIEFAKDGVMRGKDYVECVMCHEPTRFVEIYSEGRFCSDECMDAFYDRFAKDIEKYNTL